MFTQHINIATIAVTTPAPTVFSAQGQLSHCGRGGGDTLGNLVLGVDIIMRWKSEGIYCKPKLEHQTLELCQF